VNLKSSALGANSKASEVCAALVLVFTALGANSLGTAARGVRVQRLENLMTSRNSKRKTLKSTNGAQSVKHQSKRPKVAII